MASDQEIMKYLKLSVSVESAPDKQVQQHIRQTVLGTPGKIRYRHTSFDSKLNFLGRMYFINLRKSAKLLGTIAFSLRNTRFQGHALRSWNVRYFSVRAPLRENPSAKQNKNARVRTGRDNILKATAETFFSNPEQVARELDLVGDRSIIYAYIEKENHRSWNFSESVDFETVGKIHTTLFSRFRPGKSSNVHSLKEAEKEQVLSRLESFYRDYSMYTDHNLFFNDHYLVWKEDGRIVAGCQANPEKWQIVHIPGFMSSFFLKGLARLPVISKRFDPRHIKFVAFEGIWYEKGYESCLLPLFESALALHQRYLGVFWLDSSSPIFKRIRGLGKRGIVGRFFTPMPGDIRVRFINWNDGDRQAFREKPCYISCFDLT